MTDDITVTVARPTSESGVLVLAVTGEIDLATAPLLHQDIAAVGGAARHLVLDFAGVGFCDSSGMSVLFGLWRSLSATGGSLHLATAPRAVTRALRMVAMDQFIPLHTDVDTALDTLRAPLPSRAGEDTTAAPPP